MTTPVLSGPRPIGGWLIPLGGLIVARLVMASIQLYGFGSLMRESDSAFYWSKWLTMAQNLVLLFILILPFFVAFTFFARKSYFAEVYFVGWVSWAFFILADRLAESVVYNLNLIDLYLIELNRFLTPPILYGFIFFVFDGAVILNYLDKSRRVKQTFILP